ncbi:hypothetical protein CJU89_1550 [Yarrowia sp. B02]|nr:hypothetical protein CJU89_1550 [Yarrowia sp. B02]
MFDVPTPESYMSEWKDAIRDFEHALEDLGKRFELGAGCTDDQRLAAVKQLTAEHASLVESFTIRRQKLEKRKGKTASEYHNLSVIYLRLPNEFGRGGYVLDPESRRISDEFCSCRSLFSKDEDDLFKEATGSQDAAKLQQSIQKLVEAAQTLVLIQNNSSAAHVTRYRTGPWVQLAPQRIPRFGPGAHRFDLPLDIVHNMFRHASLETCPETELFTWGDCALVFIARIRSNKWIKAEDVERFKTTRQSQFLPVHPVLAQPLRKGEKLPRDFEGLREHDGFNCEGTCEKLHFQKGFAADLWKDKIEKTKEQQSYFDRSKKEELFRVVREDANEKVIEYDGLEITLPPGFMPDGVVPGQSHGHQAKDGSLSFPAEPTFRSAKTFSYTRSEHSFEFGNVYARKTGYGEKLSYHFWCNQRKQFVAYAPPTSLVPTASYNGLIWWVAKKHVIVPTFIDIHNPGWIYASRDRIIASPESPRVYDRIKFGIRSADEPPFVQCSFSRHAQQFLVRPSPQGLFVVDMLHRTITEVQGEKTGVVLPGFVKSWFHARSASDEVIQHHQTRLKRFREQKRAKKVAQVVEVDEAE